MNRLACCGAVVSATVCMVAGIGTGHAAPGEWAAIAYDPDGRTGWPNPGFAVWVNHAATARDAMAATVGQCSSGPGMGGSSAPCELVALVQDGCVALVSLEGVANPAAGTGPTLEATIASVAYGKRIAEVQYAACTY